MLCSICQKRKARRACPALAQQICSVCCGTKRLVEITCPTDCVYLASARDHPAAAVVRQQQHDLGWLVSRMRDLGERQSKLFFLVCSFLTRYASGRHKVGPDDDGGHEVGAYGAVIDQDVADALAALASTLETSARGVIYEHRPASMPAERLASALKPILTEVGQGGGTPFEREAAVVLRRVESAARDIAGEVPGRPRAFLELLDRVMAKQASGEPGAADLAPPEERPRLIVP